MLEKELVEIVDKLNRFENSLNERERQEFKTLRAEVMILIGTCFNSYLDRHSKLYEAELKNIFGKKQEEDK